jgi:putative transposase
MNIQRCCKSAKDRSPSAWTVKAGIDNIFIERLWKTVKYECVYIHVFEDGVELYNGLKDYFRFYNTERLHQSLGYQTPEARYKNVA